MFVQPGQQPLDARQGFQANPEPGPEVSDVDAPPSRLVGGRAHHAHEVAGAMLKFRHQHMLALLQLSDVMNVGRRAEPLDDRASLVAHRRGAGLEPAVPILGRVT